MTTNEQLELGFNGIQRRTRSRREPDRMERAAWWFGQMRRIVAEAIDWQAGTATESQPTWFTHAHPKQGLREYSQRG